MPGEFFVFLDADCAIPEPQRFFEPALSHFRSDPELVALTGYLRVGGEYETLADRVVYGASEFSPADYQQCAKSGPCVGQVPDDQAGRVQESRGLPRRPGRPSKMPTVLPTIPHRLTTHLVVLHTGRRAHQVGWLRLIFMWLVNSFFVTVFDRSFTKEWTAVR